MYIHVEIWINREPWRTSILIMRVQSKVVDHVLKLFVIWCCSRVTYNIDLVDTVTRSTAWHLNYACVGLDAKPETGQNLSGKQFDSTDFYNISAQNAMISKTKSGFECLLIYRSKYMLTTLYIILKWDSPKLFSISLKWHLLASFVQFVFFLSE